MQTDSWHRIERIFDDALACAETERAAFLGTACAGDEALQREVESLLAAQQEAEQFFGTWAAGSSPNGAAPHTPPKRIGPYQLRRELAQGGMGTVWLAERADEQYQQQVAIKLLKADVSNDDIAQRLRHERQILATLNHPNIARLLDGGTTDSGQPYLVMEYIAGVPIDAYCAQQQLTLSARLQLFRQVCAAVQYAHQHLIIHRDLKPANILVTANGTPKLLDFGIAKLLHPDLSQSYQTQDGQTPMTPAYASPEQIRSEPLTTTSDVYSLGVVLYELLTGRSPYRLKENTFGELSRAICEQELLRPSTRGMRAEGGGMNKTGAGTSLHPPSLIPHPSISPSSLKGDLDSIVLMALRKEPSTRYSSVEQFAADIQRYLDGLPTLARKGTLVYRAVKYVRRYKVPVAAAALIALSLLSGIGATSRQAQIARAEQVKAEAERFRAEQALKIAKEERRRAEEALAAVEAERTRTRVALTTAEQRRQQAETARAEADQQRAQAEAQRQRAQAQELSNRQLLYTSRMGLAQQAWDDANVERVRNLLTPYLPQPNAPDYRGFEWFYLWKLSHQDERTLPFAGQHATKAAVFSADGHHLISVCQVGEGNAHVVEAVVYDAATAQPQRRFHFPGAYFAALSPDGKALALALYGGQDIAVMSLATGQEMRKITRLSGGISCFAFVPDGQKLVIGFTDGSLGLLDLTTGKEAYRFRHHTERVFTVAVSPDGQKFVSGSNDRTARLWELPSGNNRLLGERLNRPQNALFSPEGRLVVITGSERLTAWEVASGKQLASLQPAGRKLAFSPDAKMLAVGGEDAANQAEITLLDTNTWRASRVLKGHGNKIMSLSITPDGTHLASTSLDETLKLWRLDRAAEVTAINDQEKAGGAFEKVTLSPDGARLLVGQSASQMATVWEVATGKQVLTLRGHQPPQHNNFRAFAIAVSPDGSRYATGGMDMMVKVWSAETGQELFSCKTPTAVYSLSFSATGNLLAVGGANALTLWEVNSGQQLARLKGHQGFIQAIRWVRDEKTLFTAGADGMVRLWEVPTGQLLKEFRCSNAPLQSIALAPDEKSFVAGGVDSIVRRWEVQTGRELLVLKGHTSTVAAVAISPDGKRVATGSHDKTVRLWDLTTGQELLAFREHASWICDDSVSFSLDGRLLVSADWSRVAKIWRAATDEEVKPQH